MKEPRWNPFVALGKLLFALVLIGVVLAFMAGAVLWGIIKAIWPFLVVAGVVGAIMFLVDVDRGKKQRMMAEQAARQAAWEAEQARLAALPKPPAPGVPPTGCLCSIRDCGFSHVKVSGLVMGACRPLLQGLV